LRGGIPQLGSGDVAVGTPHCLIGSGISKRGAEEGPERRRKIKAGGTYSIENAMSKGDTRKDFQKIAGQSEKNKERSDSRKLDRKMGKKKSQITKKGEEKKVTMNPYRSPRKDNKIPPSASHDREVERREKK